MNDIQAFSRMLQLPPDDPKVKDCVYSYIRLYPYHHPPHHLSLSFLSSLLFSDSFFILLSLDNYIPLPCSLSPSFNVPIIVSHFLHPFSSSSVFPFSPPPFPPVVFFDQPLIWQGFILEFDPTNVALKLTLSQMLAGVEKAYVGLSSDNLPCMFILPPSPPHLFPYLFSSPFFSLSLVALSSSFF